MSSGDGAAVATDAVRLLEIAKRNPYHHFEIPELARMLNHSEWLLRQMNREKDSPIISGKSRPERICQWLETHYGWKPSNV